MTDLNKQELRRLAEATEGWQNLTECWPADDEFDSDWEVGALDEEGNRFPVISVNTQQYDCEDGAEKLARFIAAANPAAILSLLDECERGDQWRELALQFDAHRMQAMALIRMVASGVAASSQCYEFAARAPIPGHEITERLEKAEAERDQLRAEVEALRKDKDRLDWLDRQCEAYGVEVHEGNRWVMDGPFNTLRQGIDFDMEREEKAND